MDQIIESVYFLKLKRVIKCISIFVANQRMNNAGSETILFLNFHDRHL